MLYVWQVPSTQKILSFLGKISLDSINKKLDIVKKKIVNLNMAVTAPRYKPWKKNRLEKLELTKIYLWLPRWHSGEGSACQCRRCRRPEFHPWAQRSPGAGNSNLLQYSCLKIPWTKEPDKLRSRRSERVRHDRAGRSHTHTHTQRYLLITPKSILVLLSWSNKTTFTFLF